MVTRWGTPPRTVPVPGDLAVPTLPTLALSFCRLALVWKILRSLLRSLGMTGTV